MGEYSETSIVEVSSEHTNEEKDMNGVCTSLSGQDN